MKPGVYQMSFRGLTMPEVWRFGKEPFKFAIALVLKLIAFKGPKVWLPAHECETNCEEAQLSADARQYLLPKVEEALAVGYSPGLFSVLSRNLDKSTREGYAYIALHRDKMHYLFLGYIASDASGFLRRTVSATGGLSTSECEEIEFVNHRNYFDAGSWSRKIHVSGKGIADIDAAMLNFIRHSQSVPRLFSSVTEVKAHTSVMAIKAFDARIERGLYRYVDVEAPPMLPLQQG